MQSPAGEIAISLESAPAPAGAPPLPSTRLVRFLEWIGVLPRRIPRLLGEIRRKSFHFYGLLTPGLYYAGLLYTDWLTHDVAADLLGAATCFVFAVEILRLYGPLSVNDFFLSRFSFLMRKKEQGAFTGVPFYMLGNCLAVFFFKPLVAISSILFLVLGDAAAAFIGIAFGTIKIGKKSLEGFLGCFIVCFVVNMAVMWEVPFAERISLCGALAAATIELTTDMFAVKFDDNFSIPFGSGCALHLFAWVFGVPAAFLSVRPTSVPDSFDPGAWGW